MTRFRTVARLSRRERRVLPVGAEIVLTTVLRNNYSRQPRERVDGDSRPLLSPEQNSARCFHDHSSRLTTGMTFARIL